MFLSIGNCGAVLSHRCNEAKDIFMSIPHAPLKGTKRNENILSDFASLYHYGQQMETSSLFYTYYSYKIK
ncbi:MAG: hypothetical protein PHC92_11270, partial [Syntrophomonadaceae bacterium]|nr:hypothetical protein [Syntrophomonadaceae bacterium]